MNRNSPQIRSRLRIIACLLPLASGCVGGYTLSALPPGIRSVQVPAFVNKTGEPLLESETTAATIREFQRDGTLRIAEPGKADSILNVVLTNYDLEPVRYEPNRPKTVREYRVTVRARMTLNRSSGARILTADVFGNAGVDATGDIAAAKRSALPAAASDLAHKIVSKVIEYW